jgi:hypothetical protein
MQVSFKAVKKIINHESKGNIKTIKRVTQKITKKTIIGLNLKLKDYHNSVRRNSDTLYELSQKQPREQKP